MDVVCESRASLVISLTQLASWLEYKQWVHGDAMCNMGSDKERAKQGSADSMMHFSARVVCSIYVRARVG